MKKLVLAAAATCALLPAAASAQDNDGGFTVAAVGGLDVIGLEADGEDEKENGFLYGLAAGYDVIEGKTLFGLEAEATGTTISDDIADAGLDLYGGVRLGYVISDEDTVYLKAGYTNVDVDLADNLEGIRVGAGYERNFGGLFGRLEYRYSNYNISDVLSYDANGNRHQVVAALGARF